MALADPEILKGGIAEDNVSAPSSFIANAHNELHAFYTGKGDLGLIGRKIKGEAAAPHSPFLSATACIRRKSVTQQGFSGYTRHPSTSPGYRYRIIA